MIEKIEDVPRFTALEPAFFPWVDYTRYAFSLGLHRRGLAVLSGQVGAIYDDEHKRVFLPHGMPAQLAVTWKKIEAALQAGGFAVEDTVRAIAYVPLAALSQADDVQAFLNVVIGKSVPIYVQVVRRLLRPDAIVEIEILAARDRTVVPNQHRFTVAREGAPGTLTLWDAQDAYAELSGLLEAAGTNWSRVAYAQESVIGAAARVLRDQHLAPPTWQPVRLTVEGLSSDTERIQISVVVVPDGTSQDVSDRVRLTTTTEFVHVSYVGNPGLSVVEAAQECYVFLAKTAREHRGQIVKTVEFVTESAIPMYKDTASLRKKIMVNPQPAATGVVLDAIGASSARFAIECMIAIETDR